MIKIDRMKLGKKVKNLRMKYGISQEDLAIKSNLTQSKISNMETGNGYHPTIDSWYKIADYFNIPLEEFLK